MMTYSGMTAGMAEEYFEHELDYYTDKMTNYDRWHGTLAAEIGLQGEMNKEQFDILCKQISEERGSRQRVGMDCTFSAPKSVSLALAAGEEIQKDMIEAHQAAISKMVDKIEMEYLGVKEKGKSPFLARNCVAAEFVHFTARPTEENNFTPDLDLHSHVGFMNVVYADGKDRAADYGKITHSQKELGLMYRQELAQELQKRGYELELTDEKQGFFELAGFDRETIERYSHREAEIKKHAEEKGVSKAQAITESRTAKDAARGSYQDIIRATREDLFQGKITIERKEQNEQRDHRDQQRGRGREENPGVYERGGREPDLDSFSGGQKSEPLYEALEGRDRLSHLPDWAMDSPGDGTGLLLSPRSVAHLAREQSRKIRGLLVQREAAKERTERINKIAEDTIKTLSREKFAFTVQETKARIMAAGVLEGISKEEAAKAIEAAGVVNLGKLDQPDTGRKTRDRYITTEENIKTEQDIKNRVQNGKDVITANIFSVEEARSEIDRVEEIARAEGRHNSNFSANSEQRAAVEHVLCCSDRYIGIDGLAGTGKTSGTMTRLKWIADEHGITLRGVCFTGQAAEGLQNDTGIESVTIHKHLNRLERESGIRTEENGGDTNIKQKWDFSQVREIPAKKREIWIVDEAGLVDMHLMDQLQRAAETRGAQIVLMGDPLQLPPVGAGEPMKQMEAAGMATAHLTNINRQKDEALLQAVRDSVTIDKDGKAHLKTFEALEAMKAEDERGNYREVKDAKERRAEIVAEITDKKLEDYQKNLLLVSTNDERKIYNRMIREEYLERGELSKEKGREYIIENEKGLSEKREFAPGDHLIFMQNEDKNLNVKNGTIGEVDYVNGKYIGVTVERETESGHKYYEMVEIDTEQYKKFDYAYAMTEYKAQGKTLDKVVADMNTKAGMKTRNQLYVDLSRAKYKAIIYTDDKKKLEKQTAKFAKKITSRDFQKRIDRLEAQQGIKNNDRWRDPTENQAARLEKNLREIEKHTLQKQGREQEQGQERKAEAPERDAGQKKTPDELLKETRAADMAKVEEQERRREAEKRESPEQKQEQERRENRRQEKPQPERREPVKDFNVGIDDLQRDRIRAANARMDTFEAEQAAAKKAAEREAAIRQAKATIEAGKKQGLTKDAPNAPVRSLTPTPPGGGGSPPMPGGR